MAHYTSVYNAQQMYRFDPAGLPGEEYRKLRRGQDRERLEKHFEPRESHFKPLISLHSAYRTASLSQDQRLRISEVKSATRVALGSSFDFDDDSYGRLDRHEHKYQRSHGWVDDAAQGGNIPQKYLDEFNQHWHEDDEENDADQYMADHAREAPWRKHAPALQRRLDLELVYGNEPVYTNKPIHTNEPIYTRPLTKGAPPRIDSGYGSEYEPPRTPQLLPSKFSFDHSIKKPKRRFLGRFRHR
jgi:hypothetical protein